MAKDSAVGKAMFALFLLVFAALAAQVCRDPTPRQTDPSGLLK